jgi:hypothetical protein
MNNIDRRMSCKNAFVAMQLLILGTNQHNVRMGRSIKQPIHYSEVLRTGLWNSEKLLVAQKKP